MIKELSPIDNQFGSSLYNNVKTTVCSGFETNNIYEAKGYTENWENIINFEEFERFNNRLVAKTSHQISHNNKEITIIDKYDYDYNVYFNNKTNKVEIEKDKSGKPVKKEFTSGPNKEQSDFKFSLFGALNIQTEKIDQININVDLNTYHGSSTWLDKFWSNALIDIQIYDRN